MTDAQIIAALLRKPELPATPNPVICEFHCGYQKALRCLEAARVKRPEKILTLDDF